MKDFRYKNALRERERERERENEEELDDDNANFRLKKMYNEI